MSSLDLGPVCVVAYTTREGGPWIRFPFPRNIDEFEIPQFCRINKLFAVQTETPIQIYDTKVGWRDAFEYTEETQPETTETSNTRSSTMDKNIFAMLRDGAYTVEVQFYIDGRSNNPYSLDLGRIDPAQKVYTYVTDLPRDKVVVGAKAIVAVSRVPKIVRIVEVHDGLDIQPNEEIQYKWLLGIVDFSYADKLKADKEEVEKTLATSYRNNARNQFKQLLLSSMDEEARTKLLSVLGEQK